MKYQLGDRVLLLHSNEEGDVVDIINEKMVLIDVEGVRFPVYTDQIDFPYFKRFTEKKFSGEKKKQKQFIDDIRPEKKTSKYNVSSGAWVIFLPVFDKDIFDEDVVESFKIYLLNQTMDHLQFNYSLKFAGVSDFELTNNILPFTDFYLHDVPFSEMNDAPRFDFLFSLPAKNKKKADHFAASIKIKAKQLFQKIEEMRINNDAFFSYQLFDEYPDKQENLFPDYEGTYQKPIDASQIKANLPPARSVIDLHIEKLADDHEHMSNFEMLSLQLNTFQQYFDLALAHHQPNLTVVHGLGTGKLKDEIHEILKMKKEVKSFINQYHPNYGFGATEIYFQY